MKVVATSRFIRQSPRKVRLVATAVRKLPPQEAMRSLQLMNARAAKAIRDTIQSAMANATNNHQLQAANLRIETLEIGEGPTLKRMRAVSRGRGVSVLKRTSHIRVVLTDEALVVSPKKQIGKDKAKEAVASTVEAQKPAKAETKKPAKPAKKTTAKAADKKAKDTE